MPADGTSAAIAPAEISAFLPASEAAEKRLHPVAAKASVSESPPRRAFYRFPPSLRERDVCAHQVRGYYVSFRQQRTSRRMRLCRRSAEEPTSRAQFECEDVLPVILHADNGPTLLFRRVVHRLAQGADLGIWQSLCRTVSVLACCIIVHHQRRQPRSGARLHVLQHLLIV